MAITQVQVTSLKPGRFIVIDGIACKITDMQVGKAGKHGPSKCRVFAVGVINGEKKIAVMPGHEKVDVPIIEKKNAQVLSVQENSANVMDTESYETFDLKIPDELKGKVKEGDNVLYWIILEDKVLMEVKSG